MHVLCATRAMCHPCVIHVPPMSHPCPTHVPCLRPPPMGAPHLGPGSFGVSLRAPQMGAALWGPGRFESHGDPINKGPSFGSCQLWGLIETLQMGAPHLGPGSFGVSPRPPQMGAPQDGAASIERGVSMATATPWQRRCTAWKPAGNPGNGGGEPRYLGGGRTAIYGGTAPRYVGTKHPNL